MQSRSDVDATSKARDANEVRYVASPDGADTLASLLFKRAEASPDALFVDNVGRRVTYSEALTRAAEVATGLARLGIGQGDAVAVMLGNKLEFLDTWFATALLGAVVVPVNTAAVGEGLAHVLQHSESKIAIVDSELTPAVDRVLPPGALRRVVVGSAPESSGWVNLDEVRVPGAAPPKPTIGPDDVASILYTSGTTGPSKGVVNGHRAYLTAADVYTRDIVRIRPDDVLFTSLPLFHVNAQMLSVTGSLLSGRPLYLAERFSASRFLDQVRAAGATVFNYIGAMLTMIWKQPERSDDADNPLRLAVGGAAPAELWPHFERRFGLTILEIYGLTESATFCLGSPPDAPRVGKLGVPVRWAEVEVRTEDGKRAKPGEPGEIVVRAKRPGIMFHGYYRNPEATAAAVVDGWFHTGDRGVQDEDGYFRFLDRKKDVIRRRGENISSYELERAINQMPGIAESAAVGVPAEVGEEDVLVVAVRADPNVTEHDVVAWCEERVARFMVPRYVRFVDALPKTATQRVQKYILRQEGIAGAWDREAAAAETGPQAG